MRLRQNGRTERSLAAEKGVTPPVGRTFRNRARSNEQPGSYQLARWVSTEKTPL